ncbi:MAG: GrpB family protein [Bacteroidota bacterium]
MEVKVVKYNPKWIDAFDKEAAELKEQIGNNLKDVHHIGSTAVPNLMAKPIIDMILEVRDLKELDIQTAKLEAIGYEGLGENGIPGRRYFRKGGYYRTHQIHAFESGDPSITRHLAFRDYLRAHEEIAIAYGVLKSDITKRCNNDIERYCDEKDDFVKHHEAIAIQWYKNAH